VSDVYKVQTYEDIGDRAFCVAEAKTWNSLPSKVTLSTFKQKLKT